MDENEKLQVLDEKITSHIRVDELYGAYIGTQVNDISKKIDTIMILLTEHIADESKLIVETVSDMKKFHEDDVRDIRASISSIHNFTKSVLWGIIVGGSSLALLVIQNHDAANAFLIAYGLK